MHYRVFPEDELRREYLIIVLCAYILLRAYRPLILYFLPQHYLYPHITKSKLTSAISLDF